MGERENAHIGAVSRIPVVQRSFAVTAAWQFAAFFILLLLVWANSLLDLPALLFGVSARGVDLFGSCIVSAGVLVAAVVTVGQTYLRQRAFAAQFVTVCSDCRRVKINEDLWQGIEDYMAVHSRVMLSHGLCPHCFEQRVAALNAEPCACPREGHPPERM